MSSSIFNFEDLKKIDRGILANIVSLIIFAISCWGAVYRFLYHGVSKGLILSIFAIVMIIVLFLFKQTRLHNLILLFGTFIFLVGGEVCFRLAYFGTDAIKQFSLYQPASFYNPIAKIPFDAGSFTGIKPKAEGIFRGVPYTINDLGFIDQNRDFSQKRAYRIIICGSSASQGFGVSQKDNYGAQLERLLNQQYSPHVFEVINLSFGGYSMEDMVHVLEKVGMVLEPDLILMEAKDTRHYPSKIRYPQYRFTPAQLNRMVWEKPYERFFFLRALKDELIPDIITLFDPSQAVKKVPKNKQVGEEEMEGYFQKIRSIIDGKKVYFVALRPLIKLANKDKAVPEMFINLTQKYDFELIDTYEENYGNNEKKMIVYIGDRHPNAKTHGIYAKKINHGIENYIFHLLKTGE